jgi:ubiquinone/menaquinone biosynthesis C-methylase UbiE
LKANLIDFIVCPKCKNKFQLKSEKQMNSDIQKGLLICSKNHQFPILEGVPRLVVDTEKNFEKTETAFSSKWKNFNKSYHNKRWYDKQRRWFLDRFGWYKISNLVKFLKKCDYILDAGTGIGNSAHWFSANKDSTVFAIDASESVFFANKKYGKISNIHFLQADIRQLPFKKNFFSFICSDQVLHHTKDTKTSFINLTKHLKKNGLISIYVYKKKGPIREFSDDYIRGIMVDKSEKECMKFSESMAKLGRNLSKLNKKITIKEDIPSLKIKAGKYDLQRFIYWNFLKCWWSNDVPFAQSVATNFDWYFPKFAYRHSPDEVKSWFKQSKLKITHFQEIESGISVNGKKL